MERRSLTIGHLFPEFLNMYGDKGNIQTLVNRLRWREMDATVLSFGLEDVIDFSGLDIILLGGGSDREQQRVCQHLQDSCKELSSYIEAGGVFLALCGSYPMMGNSFVVKNQVVKGLSVLSIDTEPDRERHIGDVVISSDFCGQDMLIAGFENHSGRTHIGQLSPLGTVRHGFGNNGQDGSCGVVYKNFIGTYLHGPLLPKNPQLADEILSRALEKKYGEAIALMPLYDQAETDAHDYIIKRFLK